MNEQDDNIAPYYRTATDIGYYFRDAKSISKFMNFFVEEAYVFSEIIKKNGDKIPYPVQFSDKGFSFQTDYQFLIHVLGKFVAKETNDPVKYKKVVKHFAILNSTIVSPVFERNRVYLMVILEKMSEVLSMQNWDLLVGNRKNPRLITQFVIFNPAVFKLDNDVYFEMKIVSFNRHKLEYYIEDWKKILAKYERFFMQKNIEQVAYYSVKVEKFWMKSEQAKMLYFPLNENNLLIGDDKYEEVSA